MLLHITRIGVPRSLGKARGAGPVTWCKSLAWRNRRVAMRRDGLHTTCTGRNGTYACSETVLQLRKGIVDASRMAWRPYDCPPLSAPAQPEVARLLAGRRAQSMQHLGFMIRVRIYSLSPPLLAPAQPEVARLLAGRRAQFMQH